ncbi:MAG: hypothetical protein ACREBB_02790 [Nitrosotalea sp.]
MGIVHLTVYKITGSQLFFNVPSRVCEECDMTVNAAKKVISEINDPRVSLEIKPWLNKLLPALFKGGWHPPVLLVNGTVFSQGVVPDGKKLEEKILEELEK